MLHWEDPLGFFKLFRPFQWKGQRREQSARKEPHEIIILCDILAILELASKTKAETKTKTKAKGREKIDHL